MKWSLRDVIAAGFVIEAAWMLVRSLVHLAEGWPVNLPWSIGLVVGPGTLLAAAWFIRRREPPTLLTAAIARTLVLFLAIAWNLLALHAISVGRFTLV
jgi:hypothetical protein